MNCIRLSDSELESAMLVLQTALDDFSFDGDMKDYKMGWVTSIMLKQCQKMVEEKKELVEKYRCNI